MGRDCASERVPIALAEGRPEDPRAKASTEIDVAAVTVEGSPQTGPERPAHPIRRLVAPSALKAGMTTAAIAAMTVSAHAALDCGPSYINFGPQKGPGPCPARLSSTSRVAAIGAFSTRWRMARRSSATRNWPEPATTRRATPFERAAPRRQRPWRSARPARGCGPRRRR